MLYNLKQFAVKHIPGVRRLVAYRHRFRELAGLEKRVEVLESFYLARKTAELLRGLQPHASPSIELVRIGKQGDGGYVMANRFDGIHAAYSLGIGDDVSWDKIMADKSIPVYMYDHTIDQLPENHPNFHYFKIGVCGKPNIPGMKDLGRLIEENGHKGKNLILKMDIEGSEYPVVDAMDDDDIRSFSQIICEIHQLEELLRNTHRHNLIGRCLNKLLKHMYCVHIHANNVGWQEESNGVSVPVLLELTLVRKDLVDDFVATDSLRTDLDFENKPSLPKIDVSYLWKQA